MNMNVKSPGMFTLLFFVIQILGIAIAQYAISDENVRSMSILFNLFLFTVLYSILLRVQFSEKFKGLSSRYITIVEFLGSILLQVISSYSEKPSFLTKLWTEITNVGTAVTTPPIVTLIFLICLCIFAAAIIYIINYFIISWGNAFALWFLQNKKISEI